MTSETGAPEEAFVWVWLPGKIEPVVAGVVAKEGEGLRFNYGRSYLKRADAVSLYEPELPLQEGELSLPDGLIMPSTLRDAAPDRWGRRVILNKKFGKKGQDLDNQDLSELTYMLESGSDRIGALDFQASPTEYVPRSPNNASLDELVEAAELVERGVPLTPELEQALHHGTAIGGARPKALIETAERKFVAKFSTSADVYSVVKAEFIAMRLAKLCGLDVANVELAQSAGKDVLLVERFDRIRVEGGWERRMMVSALTMLELREEMGRYASYELLAEIIRLRFREPTASLHEFFARLTFNILCGNTDDHARNHAAFWDGVNLRLTPAYDICPQGRTGQEASQGMEIAGGLNQSKIAICLAAAPVFLLGDKEAGAIVEQQVVSLAENWSDVCDEAKLSEVDRNLFWGRQFLNPFAFYDLEGDATEIAKLADSMR